MRDFHRIHAIYEILSMCNCRQFCPRSGILYDCLRWPRSAPPNSNHSHRIQITHTEFKLLTPNSKHLHRILNHSHRVRIAHTEFESLTPNSKHLHRIGHFGKLKIGHFGGKRKGTYQVSSRSSPGALIGDTVK